MRESKRDFGHDEDDELDDLITTQPKTDVPGVPNRDVGPHGTKEVNDVPNSGDVTFEPPD